MALLSAGCDQQVPDHVDARDYDRFWLWAGTHPPDGLAKAREIYLLDSEIRGSPPHRVVLRPGIPDVRGPILWLVVRTDQIPWTAATQGALIKRLDQWRAAGGHIAGLQVDFDARTRGLSAYATFLSALRTRLPRRYRLSITGLMDWSANGNPAVLAVLGGSVDEVVIQTYQGRKTILGYDRYFARMTRFPLPFKVGLVEGGQWIAPPELARNRNFRGYVVFLVNPSAAR